MCVWSQDASTSTTTERAGALEAMHPAVRASRESGTVVPLLEAAVADPCRGLDQDTVTAVGMLRREEALDRPFPWQETVGNQPRWAARRAELPT